MNRLFHRLLFATFLAAPALACEYNVRDVGFVELTTDPYQLYGFVDDAVPDEAAATFARLAYSTLIDTNLDVKMVNLADTEDAAAQKWVETLGIVTFPALALISPDGRGHKVALPAPDDTDYENGVRDTLDRLVMSPLRKEIMGVTTTRYGLVVIVQGSNAGSNMRAEDAAEDAVTKIHARMNMLPKPIAEPPRTMVITPEQARTEPLLMWALDLAEYAADTPPEDAAAVVLYSRVRRMGPNLRGKELTPEFVTKFLSVIGADCECGLDRSWMQGTMLPIRWDSDTQKQVAAALGFDPEDPMTKTEISITISKGARTGGGSTSISPESDFSFGYTEFSPDEALAEEEADGEQPEEVPVEATSPAQPVAEEALAAVAPALETPAHEPAPPAEPAPSNLHLLWVLAALGIVAVAGSAFVLIRSNRG